MTRLWNRLRREWDAQRLKRMVQPAQEVKLTRLGTDHGGWVVPQETLERRGTAVCVGAGEDISFDVELNRRGLEVVTLDPTPRAKKHVESVLEAAKDGRKVPINRSEEEHYDLQGFEQQRFKFAPLGVWKEEKTMQFFAPKDKEHVSHSIVNLQKTEDYFEAKCVTLRQACAELEVSDVDLLKMDIEGAEYEVLRNLVKDGPQPEVLCVEFDEIRNPLDAGNVDRIEETVQMLKDAGYTFQHLEQSNALFLRRN